MSPNAWDSLVTSCKRFPTFLCSYAEVLRSSHEKFGGAAAFLLDGMSPIVSEARLDVFHVPS